MKYVNPYRHRPFDFVEKVDALKTFNEISNAVAEELTFYGFSCVTSFMMPGPGEKFKQGVHLNTRPQEYIDRYEEKNYVLQDPVVIELRHSVRPFSWKEVIQKRRLSKSERNIIEEAQDFDVNNGLIIPIVTLSGSMSVFSPCGHNPDLSPEARYAVELIAIYSHEALKRKLLENSRQKTAHKPLTNREREILLWVANGKSDDEIAEILSLSPATVTLHVQNAKRKLDAFRRTFAVVKAIRSGEINI